MINHSELNAREQNIQDLLSGEKIWTAWRWLMENADSVRLTNAFGGGEDPREWSIERGVFEQTMVEIDGERFRFSEDRKGVENQNGETFSLLEVVCDRGLEVDDLGAILGLNRHGFDSAELAGKDHRRSAELLAMQAGPWVLQSRKKQDGSEAEAVLLRYDDQKHTYKAMEDSEVIRWIDSLAPLDISVKEKIVKNLRGLDLPVTDGRRTAGWIFLENGDLDLETGELEPADPARVCVFRGDTPFDPEAESELANRFLGWYEPDDLKGIFRMFAYTLFERQPRQCFFYIFGKPGGGKSTLLELLMEAVYGKGQNVAVFDPGADLDSGKNAFGLEGLDGAAILYNPDMGERFISDTGILKSIVGGNPVTINEKHKSKYTCTLGGKVILVSNNAPRFQDTSGAIKDRAVVFHLAKGGLRGSADEIRLDAVSAEEKRRLKQVLLRKVLEEYRWLANHPEAGKEAAFPRSAKSMAALKGFDDRESGLSVLRGMGSAILGLSPKAFMEAFDEAWQASPYAGNAKGKPEYDNLREKLAAGKVGGVPISEIGFDLRLKWQGVEVVDRKHLRVLMPDPKWLAEQLGKTDAEVKELLQYGFVARWRRSRGAKIPTQGLYGLEKDTKPACPFFGKRLEEPKKRELEAWFCNARPKRNAGWEAILGLLEEDAAEGWDDAGEDCPPDWQTIARTKELEIERLKQRIAELEALRETAEV